MGESALVDAGFIVALLSDDDTHHKWAASQAAHLAPPWRTCEAALSEAFYVLGPRGVTGLTGLLRRRAIMTASDLAKDIEPIAGLMKRFANVPMSFADACLVRMTELAPNLPLLTTDSDFRIYRRYGRQVIPFILPAEAL